MERQSSLTNLVPLEEGWPFQCPGRYGVMRSIIGNVFMPIHVFSDDRKPYGDPTVRPQSQLHARNLTIVRIDLQRTFMLLRAQSRLLCITRHIYIYMLAEGSYKIKALCYKPEGRRFETQ
jgi:hypothetical protein